MGRSQLSMVVQMTARFVVRVGAVVVAMNRAQRRAAVLHLACDRYLDCAGRPPQTYGEFMARTAGPLLHEPLAAARRAGRMVG
jgi:hypothetical protein